MQVLRAYKEILLVFKSSIHVLIREVEARMKKLEEGDIEQFR